MALYKDLYGLSYNNIAKEFKGIIDVAKKTIEHNISAIRSVLCDWGKTQVPLGNLEDWNQAAKEKKFKKQVKGTNLWIDSTDFKMKGKRSTSRTKGDWSYKCNAPGRRYMFISDGVRIRKIIGRYSPKIHDGKLLELFRDFFETDLKGATIIGDQHFEHGKKHFKNVLFHTPIKKASRRDNDLGEDEVVLNTNKEVKYNAAVRQARAQVETPFGIIDAKFDSLKKCWWDSVSEMDKLIYIAAGIINSEACNELPQR